MGRSSQTLTVERELNIEPYQDLVYTIGTQAVGDIEAYLSYLKKDPAKQVKDTLYRLERDYRQSIRFFTIPYGEGSLVQDISYFAYLIHLVGGNEALPYRLKKDCLKLEKGGY